MSLFLAEVSRRHPREFILMVLDGAGWHRAGDLVIPERMRLYPLPARSPELNPAEHVWEEWRGKGGHKRLFPRPKEGGGRGMRGLAGFGEGGQRVGSLGGVCLVFRGPLTTPLP